MKKLKVNGIYDPIYRQNYWYICTKDHKECVDWLNKKFGTNDTPKDMIDGHMSVFQNPKGTIQVIWTNKKSPDLVAHEVMHAVSYSLRHKGLPLTEDTEEAYCYLFQFLMNEIFNQPR